MDSQILTMLIQRVNALEKKVDVLTSLETPYAAGSITPTLVNGWVNYGSGYAEASYYKDAFGVVHIQGLIKDGITTSTTVLFTLPLGHRPSGRLLFATLSHSGLARVDVLTNGNVCIITGSNVWLSLDTISFKAA